MNYLHPQEPDREDTLKEHIACNRIFARALSFLLKEKDGKGEGVVVVMDNEKMLVHASGNQIKVSEFNEDIPEGSMVWYHEKDDPEEIIKTEHFKEFCKELNFEINSKQAMQEYLHSKWLHEMYESGASPEEFENFKKELELTKNLTSPQSKEDL